MNKRISFVFLVGLVLLSACSGNAGQDAIALLANAASNGDAPASHTSIQWSERNECEMGSLQMVLNKIDAQLSAQGTAELPITADQWIDQNTKEFSCLKER